MSARPRTQAGADDLPAVRLAVHVEAAIAQLQRGIREAATPSRELTDDELQVALALDDLEVTLSDLGLLARELRSASR